MYVWTLLRVAFFFRARPRKTGDTECSEQGGDSHEREQSTRTPHRKALPLRDQPLVRWSPMPEGRQGKRRWTRSVREAARREREDVVELLEVQRLEATSARHRAYEDLDVLRSSETPWEPRTEQPPTRGSLLILPPGGARPPSQGLRRHRRR